MKTETDLDSGLPKLSSKRIKLEMGSDIKNKKNRSSILYYYLRNLNIGKWLIRISKGN